MIRYHCPRAAATAGVARGCGGTRGGQGIRLRPVAQGLTPLATPGRPRSGAPEDLSYTLSVCPGRADLSPREFGLIPVLRRISVCRHAAHTPVKPREGV